jgi:hypothetical protein
MNGSSIPPAPPGAEAKASSRATTALILGILGFVCCQLCAPFAWYMGQQELKAIKAGQSSMAGQGFATAGWILGIIGSILLVFVLLWFFFLGGMAMIAALSGASGAAQ